MLPDARLDVGLCVRGGVVAEVAIRSTRLVQASRLFAGRQPEEVTGLLPTLFALCGTAQVLAGLAAMEQAADFTPSAAQVSARRLLLLAETVAEHGMALARDWPALVGAEADLAAARRIKTAMAGIRPALYPAGGWNRVGGGALTPDRAALDAAIASARTALADLLGGDVGVLVADLAAFEHWRRSSDTPAARLMQKLSQPDWAGFGAGPFLPMPEQGPADLGVRLAADNDGAYVARPDSAGQVYETGALARQSQQPVVAEQMEAFGPGLLARMTARLSEVASCLQEMENLVHSLASETARAALLSNGTGLGLVEAARGLLAHRVELEGGRVKRYQIVAPTEWNFHPMGPLVRGLRDAAATPDLAERANWLACALDPCVACAVTVEHADA